MIHLTRALVRRWLDTLLHIDDTPERTAAAFALGVFFGFSPFLGLHTLLGIAFAFLLNLNRVAVLLGVYSNLPWIIAPYYAFATMVGRRSPATHAAGLREQLQRSSSCRCSSATSGTDSSAPAAAALAVHRRLAHRRVAAGRRRLSAGARVRHEPPAHRDIMHHTSTERQI